MSTTIVTSKAAPARVDAGSGDGRRNDSYLSGVVSTLSTVLLVAVMALAGALVVYPKVVGGGAWTVLTGSMTPTYEPGDVVVTKPVDISEVRIGDVVTFMPNANDSTLVTHRVIGKSIGAAVPTVTTQGDANGSIDAPIEGKQIVGKVVYSVPKVGHALNAVGGQRQLLTYLAAGALVLYGLVMMLRPERKNDDRHRVSTGTRSPATPDSSTDSTIRDTDASRVFSSRSSS